MSAPTPLPGSIGWHDLTVPNAVEIRDFYAAVVGWKISGIDMGGYEDFCMTPPGAEAPAAGICHARGPNADIPPQWLMYISVTDVDHCVSECRRLGGSVVVGPKEMGGGRFAIIRDPAGAVAALFQSPPPA